MPGQYRDYQPQDDPQVPDGDPKFLGVNARLAADKLPPGMVANAKNARMRTGEALTRLGVVKPGWLNVLRPGIDNTINPVGQFYGVGVFKDPNGEQWVLTCADGNIYRHKVNNPRFQLPLPAGVRLLSRCVPVQAFNNVFLFRGRYLQPLLMTSIDNGFVDIEPRWSASTVYNAFVQVIAQAAQEVAYGPFQAVGSLTSVGNMATVATSAEHGYVTGADVVITGASPSAYNGRFNITVLDVNTFQYSFAGGTSPATGTIKVSNMANYWQALGSVAAVSTLTRSGTTATCTTSANHGFTTGQYVTIAGATPVAYNGVWLITVTGLTTFTFTLPADPGSNATGTMTARTSVVLAGQSPDTNPEAWQQIFNVLPNADDAVFTNNRLLVPTAWTPGTLNYDSTSAYTKKDFIVAMDIGDNVHFAFTNELRINQGSNDEIQQIVKFTADQCLVLKQSSWGILSGLSGSDLSQVSLDMHDDGYGSCAQRAAIAKGANVFFPMDKRGLAGLMQTELGITRSVDIPFSNDLEAVIGRINWVYKGNIRLASWDDKLYAAVPLDDANCLGPYVGTTIVAYPPLSYQQFNGLVPGRTYQFTPGSDNGTLSTAVSVTTGVPPIILAAGTLIPPGNFVATQTVYYYVGNLAVPSTDLSLRQVLPTGGNNAILVYDFRRDVKGSMWTFDFQSGEWDGYDQGSAICVLEWFKCQVNGKERLGFIGADGYASIMEEAEYDQIGDQRQPNGLGWEAIALDVLTRGYLMQQPSPKKYKRLELTLGLWAAQFSVNALTAAANSESPVRSNVSFSRTAYLAPVGKAPYVDGNANGDFATPGRGDYSVWALPGGFYTGTPLDLFQDIVARYSVRTRRGRYVQFHLTNSQGRCSLRAVGPEASEGERRNGILI